MNMDWVRGEKLGHGSFATVNLGVPRSQSSQFPPLMAVKSCGISHSCSLMNEKLILDDLKDCPQIIRCFGGSFSCENGERLYNLLLEYAPGGTLADKVKNSDDQRLPESEVRGYTKALLRGLHYIHKFGYVHCDLKLQNILLCPNGGVKIADFGLSKRTGKEISPECEFRGTPMYVHVAGDCHMRRTGGSCGCVGGESGLSAAMSQPCKLQQPLNSGSRSRVAK